MEGRASVDYSRTQRSCCNLTPTLCEGIRLPYIEGHDQNHASLNHILETDMITITLPRIRSKTTGFYLPTSPHLPIELLSRIGVQDPEAGSTAGLI